MATVSWHTEARQQPRIIGKDISGKKIPGGPYTVYQIAGLAVLPIGLFTKPLWGADVPTIAVLIMLVGITAAAVWTIGLVDWTWSPLNIAIGWTLAVHHATSSPAGIIAERGPASPAVRSRAATTIPASTIRYTLPHEIAATPAAPETDDLPDTTCLAEEPPAPVSDRESLDEPQRVCGLVPTPQIEGPEELQTILSNPEPAPDHTRPLSALEAFLAAANRS
ncbi:hypothetical protein [Acidipropionibacterium acidipropionici]|uniref:Uncharacterized protein n=1 Tax=Acidipropionibacterium acidipropionici TaxID=1748 RepID=A0AAC9AMK6_9ACTN|nr:hypothetical protein [Acidipropionibacterium acidipropionici]AMS04119.1 hypothetical protein AXH35_00100 [Acidipropionibacterium acidipropionici]